ncbi:MAG: hypothetical protein ACR2RF_26095 [Geminicoccaceae bacterium]
MKTPEEMIAEFGPAGGLNPFSQLGSLAAKSLIEELDAAGYVIQSRQAAFNTARMEAALIGIAAGEGDDANDAKAALKWCEDHPA